jgi:hypothetical protein
MASHSRTKPACEVRTMIWSGPQADPRHPNGGDLSSNRWRKSVAWERDDARLSKPRRHRCAFARRSQHPAAADERIENMRAGRGSHARAAPARMGHHRSDVDPTRRSEAPSYNNSPNTCSPPRERRPLPGSGRAFALATGSPRHAIRNTEPASTPFVQQALRLIKRS